MGIRSRSSSRMSSVSTKTMLGRAPLAGSGASERLVGFCVVWTIRTESARLTPPLAVTVASVATTTTSSAPVIDWAHPRICADPSEPGGSR